MKERAVTQKLSESKGGERLLLTGLDLEDKPFLRVSGGFNDHHAKVQAKAKSPTRFFKESSGTGDQTSCLDAIWEAGERWEDQGG